MPLYEYYCADCRSKFEVLTSYEASQQPGMLCANCQGTQVRKLVSAFARPVRGGGDDFGDYGDGGDFDSGEGLGGGGCSCGGGSCGCHN